MARGQQCLARGDMSVFAERHSKMFLAGVAEICQKTQTRGLDISTSSREGTMKTVAEYRKFAEGCRQLAEKLMDPNDKRALQMMADAWERIANERQAKLREKLE